MNVAPRLGPPIESLFLVLRQHTRVYLAAIVFFRQRQTFIALRQDAAGSRLLLLKFLDHLPFSRL
jgi:hypothetical protein